MNMKGIKCEPPRKPKIKYTNNIILHQYGYTQAKYVSNIACKIYELTHSKAAVLDQTGKFGAVERVQIKQDIKQIVANDNNSVNTNCLLYRATAAAIVVATTVLY